MIFESFMNGDPDHSNPNPNPSAQDKTYRASLLAVDFSPGLVIFEVAVADMFTAIYRFP